MRRVVVHVDRLVLRGFARGDVYPLAAGLRGELQALLGVHGAISAMSQHHGAHRVRAWTVRAPAGGHPRALVRAVATRIVRGGKP